MSKPFIISELVDLPWRSTFTSELPGDPKESSEIRQVKNAVFSEVPPTRVKSPQLVGWSDDLAHYLGIKRPETIPKENRNLDLLSGNLILPSMTPYAARYGGYQFGSWAGQLGDGRAITLGNIPARDGTQMELQLKGAGPTPYSRHADGRAVLRSSLREFLCSEAMHGLGIPTTRALSLVLTGDSVVRDLFYDGNPAPEPGAIVCRVSLSFLRFGNFEILAANQEWELLKTLANYLIRHHYPELDLEDEDVYGKLLDSISRKTASLSAQWMGVGFVHGVLNTDNMSALGLTIDYGPYGWLEPFDPNWTPNTTDARTRRYSYEKQPQIAFWNVARLGEALAPLLGPKSLFQSRVQESLNVFQKEFDNSTQDILAKKCGFLNPLHSESSILIDHLFSLLQMRETDFTLFFRGLSDWSIKTLDDPQIKDVLFRKLIEPAFYEPNPISTDQQIQWMNWLNRYSKHLKNEGRSESERQSLMKKANPKYIFRNYLAQEAIQAIEKGDSSILERLQKTLSSPFDDQQDCEDLAAKRPEWARFAPGCSALSCSS